MPSSFSDCTGGMQDSFSACRDREEALASATSLGSRLPHFRTYVSFLFEPVQAGMHGADVHAPVGPGLELVADGHPVGVAVKDGDHEQDEFLESAKGYIGHGTGG